MSQILAGLKSIADKLDQLLQRGQDGVFLTLKDYLEMKKVYDENKGKNYLIEFIIQHHHFVVDGKEIKKISNIRCHNFNFPDDTETNLTNLFQEVHQNSAWVKYLEEELAMARANTSRMESKNDELYLENEQLKKKLEAAGYSKGWRPWHRS